MADIALKNDIIAAYNPTTESWAFQTIEQFVRHSQPLGWLIGTQTMMREGRTPEPPAARPVDDGTVSGDPENVDGKQEAKLFVASQDMRGKNAAVETFGNWRLNGTGEMVTGYLRAKGNGKTLRVTYRTYGTGDRDLTLILVDLDDPANPGNSWEQTVTFPDSSSTIITYDIPAVPFPELPSVKTRFRQKAPNNGNVLIESFELVS